MASDYLSRVPDPVFVQIFQHLNADELLKSRLFSKRIHRRVLSNIAYLTRPSLGYLSIQMKQSRKRSKNNEIKRLLQIEMRKNARRPSKFFELHVNETDCNILNFVRDHISQFKLTNSLIFSGCNVNSSFLQLFLHSTTDLSSVKHLAFEMCKLSATEFELLEFIKRTACSRLIIEFCADSTASILSNKFLQHLKRLESLRVQVQSPLDCTNIGDEVLEKWCKQEMSPSTIDLTNVPVQFTVDGVLKAIRALQNASKHNNTDIVWNLGRCQWTVLELFVRLQQESRHQQNYYSLHLEHLHNKRIGIKINFKQQNSVAFKSPLNALESFVYSSFSTTKSLNRCELFINLPST
ncbi:F-box domain-containing protein [Aphelenchoides bicaudatus]|nr:F-box domain-containing protein [Aphelenchoides bicaudatus]